MRAYLVEVNGQKIVVVAGSEAQARAMVITRFPGSSPTIRGSREAGADGAFNVLSSNAELPVLVDRAGDGTAIQFAGKVGTDGTFRLQSIQPPTAPGAEPAPVLTAVLSDRSDPGSLATGRTFSDITNSINEITGDPSGGFASFLRGGDAGTAAAQSANATGGAGTDTLLEREQAAPGGAFRAALRARGLPDTGVLGSRLSALAGDAFDVRSLQEAVGQAGSEPLTQSFNQFLQGSPTRNIGGAGFNVLQALAGITDPSLEQQGFVRPTSFGSDQAQNVRGAFLAALAARSPFLAARFGNQIDQEAGRRFSDRVFAGGEPANFANFLLQQSNLR